MFVRNWKANVKILNRQVADLEEEKECVKRYIDDPNKSGAESEHQKQEEWFEKAKKIIKRADKLVKGESGNAEDDGERGTKQKCAFGLCLDPKSAYKLSKKAERYCKAIAELVQEARGFEDITLSYRQEKEAVNVFEDLKSRKRVLISILEALRSPSTNMIGVNGKEGTGKTMLLREVKRKAEEQKLFDAVVMPTLSRNAADLPRIQGEIQRALSLDRVYVSNELTTHQEAEAFNPMKARRTEKEVLLILDNIWEPEIYYKLRDRLPLVEENEGSILSYKILRISTDSAVRSDLSEVQFEILPLEEKEPLKLFKRMVSNPTESRSLPSMIADKCGTLPIAVATVANALKSSNQINWKTVIRELKRSNSEDKLQLALKISYSCLNKQLQQTFLLCSLMDHNAAIQDLLKYGIGLGLFPRINSIKEARDEVLNLVAKLRDSSLLLDSGSNLHFNMPDLFRNFDKSFASKEVELVSNLNNWLGKAKESIKWIYLSNDDTRLPNELNCPQLTFFHLSKQDPSSPIPPDLFRGTGGLRVLGLTKTWSMPQSISLLNDLRTLRLDQSVLRVADIGAIIGKLKNLQVLSLVGCDFEELPEQIGQLFELKLLDLNDCNKLKVIPPGVLSSLSRLEELYMRNSFDQWEMEGVKEQENKNASLSELKHLNLTTIEVRINICNIQMIKGDLFSENLARYMILVGDMWHSWDSSCGSSKMLKLKLDAKTSSEHSVNKLLKKTEELHLQGLNDVNNVDNELDDEGFQELKYLFIQDAQNVQHIINLMQHDGQNIDQGSINSRKPAFPLLEVLVLRNLEKMEKICHGSVKESSFSKLRMITVEFCSQLKNLFSSSIAKQNLLQLQEIRVTKCSNMEEIVDDEGQRGENDILKELRSLRLEDLPKLIGFNWSCKRMTLFQEQVASFSAGKLMKLIIKGCENLERIFPSSMAQGLRMLEHLEIRKCNSMKEVIFRDNNEEEEKNLIFPQLNILQIEDLENLVNFCSGNCVVEFKSLKKLHVLNCPKLEGFIANTQILFKEQVEFPNLELLRLSSININQICHIASKQMASVKNLKKLFVEGCDNLKHLLTSAMVKSLEQLTVLKIFNCKMMKGVIMGEERMCEIFFPELDTLELEDLPKLTGFCVENSNATISECLPTANIENVENTYMTSLFHEKVEFAKLKLLKLSSINIQQVWDLLIPKIPSSVQNLKKLFVEGCGKVKYLLTSSMVMSFEQLIMLKICDCEMMEAVIDAKESEKETISFPKLHTLELVNLPKLTRFYHAENTGTSFLFDEQVGFPELKFLSLSSIDVQQIWQISIPETSLEKLFVEDCGNLKYLLTSPMVKSFKQLKVLKICECKMMEQVVISNESVEEVTMCERFFSTLATLEFENLPKLARLCHGNYSKFKFSNLRQFTISKCAMLKTLIGDIAVRTENSTNTYTSSLFDEKVEFPILERLVIKFMGSWNKIWDDKHNANSCCQLNALTVASCEKLLNIFPFSMLERVIQSLETLEILNCNSLEEIFGASQQEAQKTTQQVETAPKFLFPKLTHLNLFKLPKLKGFFPQMHINEWPSLKQLWVYGCDGVQIFASELPSSLGINGHDKLQIRWISKNILLYQRSGEICYMLPARSLTIAHVDNPRYWRWISIPNSRIPEVAELLGVCWFDIHGRVNTSMLSPETHYKAYLVFKQLDKSYGFTSKPMKATIRHSGTEDERTVYVQAESGIAGAAEQYPKPKGDDWFEVELGEFSYGGGEDGILQIQISRTTNEWKNGIIIQGIEIRPN